MKYMLLIYSPLDVEPDGGGADMGEWFAYTEALAASGALVAGDPLAMPSEATTVRVRDGKRLVTDGPFAETKEVLLGYYLIDVATIDEALDWAERLPSTPYGSTEVRPVMDVPMPS